MNQRMEELLNKYAEELGVRPELLRSAVQQALEESGGVVVDAEVVQGLVDELLPPDNYRTLARGVVMALEQAVCLKVGAAPEAPSATRS